MSYNNDGLNQDSQTGQTGRREGFNDSRGGAESYGQGTGDGGYDPSSTGTGGFGGQNQSSTGASGFGDQTQSSTGTGGYGGQTQQRGSDDQSSDNFDGQNQSGQRAFGDDRSTEKPGFSGSDSKYDSTTTGGAFAGGRSGSGQNTGSGFGQSDDFDNNNSSSGVPGTRSSGGASGGAYGDNTDKSRDRNQSDSQQSGPRDDQYGGESKKEREGGKPSFADKMRGNAEQIAGTVTGKKDLKERGQERKTGEF